MRLFHAADIHLGRRRLDGRLPDTDFADAFAWIGNEAISGKADAFLLAGDLFDKPQVEPHHLRQAQTTLERLRGAGIPVIAIEGNHDKASLHSTGPTWLDYLADDGLLRLLKPRFDAEGAILDPWDAARGGAWLELGGVRFVGAGYLGAATPHKVRQIVDRLEVGRDHVLLLHAGPDYFVGEGGGFSREDLAHIRTQVRYLALGHIHKPMLHGGWACNPGSPENCDLREAAYDAEPRGFAWIDLAPGGEAKVTIGRNPRRAVVALELDCTPFGNKLKDGGGALVAAAVKLIQCSPMPAGAVVQLSLAGRINLNRVALDLETLGTAIEQASGAFAVAFDASGVNAIGAAAGAGGEAGLNREALERKAILDLVNDEPLWGLDGERAGVADLFFDLKEAVRTRRAAEEIAQTIDTHPLIETIRAARTAS